MFKGGLKPQETQVNKTCDLVFSEHQDHSGCLLKCMFYSLYLNILIQYISLNCTLELFFIMHHVRWFVVCGLRTTSLKPPEV